MKHIVEIPEDRLEELQAAVQKINPEASVAIGAGMDEEYHPATLGKARWCYMGNRNQASQHEG